MISLRLSQHHLRIHETSDRCTKYGSSLHAHLPQNQNFMVCYWLSPKIPRLLYQKYSKIPKKSAHTALAVKACLLGCNSATLNAQVTFVYIAVAISALAGGGGHLKFSHRNPSSAGVFVIFRTIFGRWIWRGYWDGILGRFGGVPATEKRTWEASGNGKTDNNEKQMQIQMLSKDLGC